MKSISRKNLLMSIAAASIAAAAAGCASAPAASQYSLYSQRGHSLKPVGYKLNWSLFDSTAVASGGAINSQLGSDQSVGMAGFLGQNVNEVVPIPGTDMVRVGALSEGSLSQNQFRSPTQDGLGAGGSRGGLTSDATLIFKIRRP